MKPHDRKARPHSPWWGNADAPCSRLDEECVEMVNY